LLHPTAGSEERGRRGGGWFSTIFQEFCLTGNSYDVYYIHVMMLLWIGGDAGDMAERVGEVEGWMLEKCGLGTIELAKAAAEPARQKEKKKMSAEGDIDGPADPARWRCG
jgi:hypothetical protein